MTNKKEYIDSLGRKNIIDFDNHTQIIDFGSTKPLAGSPKTDFPSPTKSLDMDYDVTERLTGLRRYNRKFVR